MNRFIFKKHTLSIIIMLIFFSMCSKNPINLNKKFSYFYKGKLKVYVKTEKKTENFKALVKLSPNKARILVLNPLNIVVFKIIVNGKESILINLKKRSYWSGEFYEIIKRVFNMKLKYNNFFDLIVFKRNIIKSDFYTKIIKNKIDLYDNNDLLLMSVKIIRLKKVYSSLVTNVNLNFYNKTELNDLFKK